MNNQTEFEMCRQFTAILRDAERLGLLKDCVWFQVPNGQRIADPKKRMYACVKDKQIGALSGVWDYCFIFRPKNSMYYVTAFLEAKSDKGRLTPQQLVFKDRLDDLGVESGVFRTVEEGLRHLITAGVNFDPRFTSTIK